MTSSVLERVLGILENNCVEFSMMRHEAVFTSEQSSKVRGTPLESGAKALICKINDDFQMFVMPANLRLSTKHVRAAVKKQRIRFASKEELLSITGLTPGCVPPFGSLFGLSTWCDSRLSNAQNINFNAGDHTVSIAMAFKDYVRLESPRLCLIAKEIL